jgi:hypothetical protein
VKLIDGSETIIIVTGSDPRAEAHDGPLAHDLKREVDGRGQGLAFRRAVVVGDQQYQEHDVFHQNPTIAIGGPGVNAVASELVERLPTVWSTGDQALIQCDFDGAVKQAALWGANAGSTAQAVKAFIMDGYLDELLRRIWRSPGGVIV